MQIQSGYVVLLTVRNLCRVPQGAKSVAVRLVDVMPLYLLGEFVGLAIIVRGRLNPVAPSLCEDADSKWMHHWRDNQ